MSQAAPAQAGEGRGSPWRRRGEGSLTGGHSILRARKRGGEQPGGHSSPARSVSLGVGRGPAARRGLGREPKPTPSLAEGKERGPWRELGGRRACAYTEDRRALVMRDPPRCHCSVPGQTADSGFRAAASLAVGAVGSTRVPGEAGPVQGGGVRAHQLLDCSLTALVRLRAVCCTVSRSAP